MNEQMSKIDKIRTLILAQTYDTAWLWDCAVALQLDLTELAQPDWDGLFAKHNWGSIEEVVKDGNEIIVWNRTDGAPPSANVSTQPKHIKILIFALCGELSKELLKNWKLSYVTVNMNTPLGPWNNCEVMLNNKPAIGVTEADAIFGTITVFVKDKRTGKFIREGDHLKTAKLSGRVDIVVKGKPQGFF